MVARRPPLRDRPLDSSALVMRTDPAAMVMSRRFAPATLPVTLKRAGPVSIAMSIEEPLRSAVEPRGNSNEWIFRSRLGACSITIPARAARSRNGERLARNAVETSRIELGLTAINLPCRMSKARSAVVLEDAIFSATVPWSSVPKAASFTSASTPSTSSATPRRPSIAPRIRTGERAAMSRMSALALSG